MIEIKDNRPKGPTDEQLARMQSFVNELDNLFKRYPDIELLPDMDETFIVRYAKDCRQYIHEAYLSSDSESVVVNTRYT